MHSTHFLDHNEYQALDCKPPARRGANCAGSCAAQVICYALERFSIAVNTPNKAGSLVRGLGLKEAVALNMIDMVGIGPFIVTPLVAQAMGGPQCLLAWVVGAAMALLD